MVDTDPAVIVDNVYSIDDVLLAAQEHVEQLIKRTNTHKDVEFVDTITAFISAVNWRERWIQSIIAFHIVLTLVIVVFRKHLGE